MAIIVIGSALLIVLLVIPLAILRAGIRRQERCRCLACLPPGLAASLTRRLIGLSVSRAAPSACHRVHAHEVEDDSLLIAGGNRPPETR
jgi:hypothetical protein